MAETGAPAGAWARCPGCGLHHSVRADGACPRCRAAVTSRPVTPAAASAAGLAPPRPAGPAAEPTASQDALRVARMAMAQTVTVGPGLGQPGPARPPPPVAAPRPAASAPEGYREAVEAFQAPPRRRHLLWLGVASAVAFVAVALLDVPIRVALLLAAVLLAHELGHWLAMRLSGQQDVRIFFIPFLGAVTTARSQPSTAGARVAIALAGPVPGIVLGMILLKLFPGPGLGRGAAVMLLYVNVFNLLPIGFLDGGRVLSTLFLSRLPALEGAFAVASIVPMAILIGGKHASGMIGGLAAGTGVAALRRYRVAMEARSLEGRLADHRDPTALPEEALLDLHAGALRVAEKVKGVKGPSQLAAVMRELWEEASAPRPTAPERVGYGFAWAAALALGWATLAETGVKLLS